MKRLMIFAGLLGVAAAGMAQERLTLQEAVATALEKNAAVIVARNNASIARNTAQSGMADMLPKLTASAGASYTDIDNISTNTVSSAGLNLSYTLFDGLGNVYRLKQARATGRMGALDARNQIENTILQVSQAYYGAASAFEGLSIAREAMGISRERLTRAKQRAAYGRAGTVDVLSAQVDVNSDSVNVVQARLAWDEAQRNLNVLLYRDLSKGMAIDTEVDYGVMDALDAFLSASTERNAGYLIYQERSRQAGYAAAAAGGAMLPRIDLTGSATYSQTEQDLAIGFDNLNRTVRAGANISWTLFNGSRLRLQHQSAKLTAQNQALLEDQAQRDLARSVTNSYEAYRNSRLVLTLETQSLEAAELNFQRSRDLYRLGQVTSTQFREAQLNLIRSKNRMQTAKYNAKLAELSLLKLSGQLVSSEQVGFK